MIEMKLRDWRTWKMMWWMYSMKTGEEDGAFATISHPSMVYWLIEASL